jgi:hypothetical protein
LLVDSTGGELERILDEKEQIPADVLERVVSASVGAFINSTYRSLRYGEAGLTISARLDAAEAVPPLLTAAFALEGRVRPFNKYLEWELEHHPLSEARWGGEELAQRVRSVLDGNDRELRALLRDIETLARRRGFAAAFDEWEPDLAWLRGTESYRAVTDCGVGS